MQDACAWEENKGAWKIADNKMTVMAGASRPLAPEDFPALKVGSSVGLIANAKLSKDGE